MEDKMEPENILAKIKERFKTPGCCFIISDVDKCDCILCLCDLVQSAIAASNLHVSEARGLLQRAMSWIGVDPTCKESIESGKVEQEIRSFLDRTSQKPVCEHEWSDSSLSDCVRCGVAKNADVNTVLVGKVEDLAKSDIQINELREICRWFANALEMKKDKLGRRWSFGYWEGADPGLALVNGGEQGIENSRFNAVLALGSGELGVILSAIRGSENRKGRCIANGSGLHEAGMKEGKFFCYACSQYFKLGADDETLR